MLFSNKKSEILIRITTWMNPESIMLGEINQIDKDEYCMTFACKTQKQTK